MKTFKQFLSESYLLRSNSWNHDDDSNVLGKSDLYGDKFKGSPEEFEKHIKRILKKQKEERENAIKREDAGDVGASYDHEIDYHLADNEHLTDKHFESVISHLLNSNFKRTISNVDIPWNILKPQAEFHLVAGGHGIRPHQMKKINQIFQHRDEHQKKMDKQ